MTNDLIRNKCVKSVFRDQIDDFSEILDSVREEFDDHLASINENTNEIQANYEYICKIDAKLDKLSERMDQVQIFMRKFGFAVMEEPKFECKSLTKNEQGVFLILYTLDEKGAVTYDDISKKSGLPHKLVSEYITNMVEKGVPILKRYIHNKVYLRLDKDFKKIQAKENILKITQQIIHV
ncbi:MAG: winged helix-turn-helix domain-containing protein [Candidatus Woesearchaeota archaeon]